MKNYIDIFEEFNNVTAFFSTKHGAVEGAPFNNPSLFEELGLENARPVWPKQVHKDRIEIITMGTHNIEAKSSSGTKPHQDDSLETADDSSKTPIVLSETDGMITNVKGVLLTTVHADCLPVYFYDEVNQAIGLVHAGWRGTLAGIAPKAAKLMAKNFGTNLSTLKAYIGPGISLCCFETGPEVYEAFKETRGFIDDYANPIPQKDQGTNIQKYYIDIKGINMRDMMDIGLDPDNIGVSPHCTCCEEETFCSYRREGGTYMRMGAGICLL